MVERDLAKVDVAGSTPVSRSILLLRPTGPWVKNFPLIPDSVLFSSRPRTSLGDAGTR